MEEQFGRFKRGLTKCRDYFFNFLENPSIPSNDKASEIGIRKNKIKTKNSGAFRTSTGADVFLNLISIVELAKKLDFPPYTAIQALSEARDKATPHLLNSF